MQGWTNALRAGSIDRTGFMNGLIYSVEGSTRATTKLYSDILGRVPDSGGLAFWSQSIGRLQVKMKDARVAFWASGERQAKSGTVEQWVSDLYTLELGRPADSGGLAFWSQVVRSRGPALAAKGVIDSSEWARRQVTAQYRLMLKREPDPGGLAGWSSFLMQTDELTVQAALGGSDEYFLNS
jgi:hypothetical protein